jgi:hypothetical protein
LQASRLPTAPALAALTASASATPLDITPFLKMSYIICIYIYIFRLCVCVCVCVYMFTSMYRYDLVAFIYILCSFTLRLSKAWHDPDLKYRILSELSFDTCHCWNRQLHYLIVPYEGFHKWRHPKMDAFVMENPNKKGSVPGNLHMFCHFPTFPHLFRHFPILRWPSCRDCQAISPATAVITAVYWSKTRRREAFV